MWRDDMSEGDIIANLAEKLESDEPLSDKMRKKIVNKLKLQKKNLHKNKTWFNSAGRIANLGSWELDLINDELKWSETIYRIFEYDPQKFNPSYQKFLDRVHPEDREKVDSIYSNSLKERESYQIVHRLKFPDGRIKYVEEHAEHFYEGDKPIRSIGTVQDVTQRELNKRKIKESLEEKKVLLEEIHHRVKNNLAVMSGLLQLQWFNENNEVVADKLQDSLNRINTIAKIHEQLYRSGRFLSVDLEENIERLSEDLLQSMELNTEIALICNCDPVHLNMNQTLPCSLIANEVVTNIIKHANKERREGEIRIEITEDNNKVNLAIIDKGIGLPKDSGNREALGEELIETLTSQLKGEYSHKSLANGSIFKLQFEREGEVSEESIY